MTVQGWTRRLPAPARAGTRAGAGAARTGTLASRILELQRLAGNRAVSRSLAPVVQRDVTDERKPDVVTGADRPAPKRMTGFVGLNPGAYKEAAGLGKRVASDRLLTSLNNPAAEKVLKESPAVFDFVVDELGIDVWDFARWDKATDVLLNADPHLREQLADVMRWFNRAEKGEIVLERLVLSGHSNGVELWGEYEEGAESRPGTMVIQRDLETIGAVFPKAVEQVEDIMFSACFSINAVEIVKKIFPRLRTVWSYGGFSPSVANGSIQHILDWEVATEGDKTLGKGLKRGSNALWTREKGYIIGDPAAAAAGPLYAETVRGWQEVAEPMYKGEKELNKSQLDAYYIVAQRLIAHPGASEDLKENARLVFQVVLRLRFWPLVTKRFGAEHGAKLAPAYEALGIPAPNWEKLKRTELKEHVERVRKALAEQGGAGGHKATFEQWLIKGIWRMEPDIIKSDWI